MVFQMFRGTTLQAKMVKASIAGMACIISLLGIVPTWFCTRLVVILRTLLCTNLVQQRIWETMRQVVIPELNILDPVERGRWEAEADKWRLPYWDWARRVTYPATSTTSAYTGFGLPYMCTQPEWDIVMPGGDANSRKIPTQNPMWAYRGDGLVMGDSSRGKYAIQQDQANDDPNNPIYFPVSPTHLHVMHMG